MNIKSCLELNNFLVKYCLTELCQDAQDLFVELERLEHGCQCGETAERIARVAKCNRHYVSFVSKASTFSDSLVSRTPDGKITFIFDGQIINEVSA